MSIMQIYIILSILGVFSLINTVVLLLCNRYGGFWMTHATWGNIIWIGFVSFIPFLNMFAFAMTLTYVMDVQCFKFKFLSRTPCVKK